VTSSSCSSHDTPSHDAAAELLGAYALHALDPAETEVVEAHVAECPRCTAELAEHYEVASLLGNAGDNAPPELWDRIAADLIRPAAEGPAAAPRLTRVTPAARRPRPARRLSPRAAVATLAAAAAIAIALLGLQVGHLDHRVSQLSATPAQRALADPQARHIALTSATGHQTLATLVVLPSGSAYLVDKHMPVLPASETYQLWSMTPGRTVSVGLLGRSPSTVAVTLSPTAPATAYAITVEPAGGVPAPTDAPVAQAAV
jgi:anti-sigma-K factor RskA